MASGPLICTCIKKRSDTPEWEWGKSIKNFTGGVCWGGRGGEWLPEATPLLVRGFCIPLPQVWERGRQNIQSDKGTPSASCLFFILLLSRQYSIPSCGESPYHVYFQSAVLRTLGHAGLPAGLVSCGKGWMALMSLYVTVNITQNTSSALGTLAFCNSNSLCTDSARPRSPSCRLSRVRTFTVL